MSKLSVFNTDVGSTPAASTNNLFIFNSLQARSAEKAKNIAIAKSFPIS